MFWQYIAIHAVASDCSSTPPTGRDERSNGPMLSSPRKPPSKTLLPSESFRFTHHVKLSSSLWNTRSMNSGSRLPSISYTRNAAHACTGGVGSPEVPPYPGRAAVGRVPERLVVVLLGSARAHAEDVLVAEPGVLREPEAQHRRLVRSDLEPVPQRCLRPALRGECVPVDDVVADRPLCAVVVVAE